jgi:hypothetical protein
MQLPPPPLGFTYGYIDHPLTAAKKKRGKKLSSKPGKKKAKKSEIG